MFMFSYIRLCTAKMFHNGNRHRSMDLRFDNDEQVDGLLSMRMKIDVENFPLNVESKDKIETSRVFNLTNFCDTELCVKR